MSEYEFEYRGNLEDIRNAIRGSVKGNQFYEIIVGEYQRVVLGDSISKKISEMGLTDCKGIVRGPIKLESEVQE